MSTSYRRRVSPLHRLVSFGLVLAVGAGAEHSRAAAPAPGEDARFALVIGWNQADDEHLEPLRYADDDAFRYHELLSTVTDRTILLTRADAETAELVAETTLERAITPTRRNVLDALQTLRAAMQRAEDAGRRPILYFVYSGHGNYDAEGRGYVHLADGRFSTRDLFAHVLEPTRDNPVILLVDACNAALLVNGRGGPGALPERRPAGRSRLDLSDFPNVGVILASSQLGETHEWGRYLAGVFSHEVRSGLLGAADLDDDQRIGFAELAAFVASANARVKNPTVRLTPYIRPPLTAPNLAIVELDEGRFRARLRIGPEIVGRAHVLDGDLVRYADFHRTGGAPPFWLALGRSGPLVLVTDDSEWVVPADARGDLELVRIDKRPRTTAATRGAGSEYFERTLFHEPFDRVFADRYLAHDYLADLEVQRFVEAPWYDNTSAWIVLGTGVAVAAGGLGMQLRAHDLEREAHATPWADERRRLNAELADFETGAVVMYGLGGAAVLSGILMFALDQPLSVETWRPPLTVDLDRNQVRLRATF